MNSHITLTFALASVLVAFAASAQDPELKSLDPVVVNGTPFKSTVPYKRLLKYHQRWLAVNAADRDKVELSFFLVPKRSDVGDAAKLKLSLVGKEEVSVITVAPDLRLEIPFDRHLDDDFAEIYANVDLQNFDRQSFVTLRLPAVAIPVADAAAALAQATRLDRMIFNPFASAKSSLSVSFGPGNLGSLSLACPGTEQTIPLTDSERSVITIKLNPRWAEQQCRLLLSRPALRVFAQ